MPFVEFQDEIGVGFVVPDKHGDTVKVYLLRYESESASPPLFSDAAHLIFKDASWYWGRRRPCALCAGEVEREG